MSQLITCSRCSKRYASVGYKGANHDIPVCLFCLDIDVDIYNKVKFEQPKGIKNQYVVVHKQTNKFYFVRFIESRNTVFGIRNYYYCDDFSNSFLHHIKWFKEEDIRLVNPEDDEECYQAENFIIAGQIGYALTQCAENEEPEPEWQQLADGIYKNLSGGKTKYEQKYVERTKVDYEEINKFPKAVSLFSGCGGYDLGISKSFNIVGHVEFSNDALKTYEFNKQHSGFGNSELIGNDITEISDDEIKKFSDKHKDIKLIFGGPPCQGFSMTGKRDPKDPRNSLFKDFVRFVKIIQPPFFQMENVKGLKSSKTAKGEKVLDIILESFRKEGYTVNWVIHDASNYGVPQYRKRIIITGIKGNKMPSFPLPTFSGPGEGMTLEDWRIQMKVSLLEKNVTGFKVNTPTDELERLWRVYIQSAEAE